MEHMKRVSVSKSGEGEPRVGSTPTAGSTSLIMLVDLQEILVVWWFRRIELRDLPIDEDLEVL